MNETPKIHKGRGRCSLSLKKRHPLQGEYEQEAVRTASPNQNSMKPTDKVLLDSPKVSISKEVPNFTPPHKKLNLDESFDDSPMSEGCYSPTFFSSQTYGSDSPDVFWNWEKDNNSSRNEKDNVKTDSGFLSSNCSSNTDSESRRKRNEKQRREYINKRMERRREKDLKLRKAQRAQAESLLKERLTQLESQLKSIRTCTQQTQEERLPEFNENQPVGELNIFDDIDNIFEQSNIDFEEPKKAVMSEDNKHDRMNTVDCFDDFFNDVDTDDLLVEATQKLESVMPELTQTVIRTETKFSNTPDMPSTTPNRNKRSSLYMEFLEDDGDDFFVSLDDDWLRKATQPNKTRSPFQRYKSMPTSSISTSSRTSAGTLMGNLKANESSKKTAYTNGDLKKPLSNASNASSAPYKTNTLRRHASSSMSPSSTHYRGRQQHSRN